MEIKKTYRGFEYIEFIDRYGVKCSLQKSSLATEDAIWLGIDDPAPKIMASKVKEILGPDADDGDGTGWIKFSIPKDVFINTRMHLTVDQVKELLPVLQKFAETGEIS